MSLDRTIAPHIYNATEFDYNLQPITTTTLQNGIPFYYLDGGSQEVVQFDIFFDAGSWHETKAFSSRMVGALLRNGTSTKTAMEINDAFEFYGANCKVNVGIDNTMLTVTCMSKHLVKLLPLVYEMLTDAQFPQTELDIYKTNSIKGLEVNLTKTDFNANRKIDELLYGYHHPYGFYNNKEHILNVTQADCKDFLYKNFSSVNAKIFLSGHFYNDVLEAIEQVFGSTVWNNPEKPLVPSFDIQPAAEKINHISINDTPVQGSIRLARAFVEKTHPDFPKMILLNTLFGGYFGSRLMNNIREDKGYTYGIYSYMYNNKYGGAFAISTEAGAAVCEKAIVEVYKEMDLLKNELISEDELQLVKNYILGNLLGDLDGPFKIMQRWKNLILFGFNKTRFDNNIQIYKSTTAEELQTLAQKYFNKDAFYEVIVR